MVTECCFCVFQIGSRRGHSYNESSFLYPSLGSGPDVDGLGSGSYSVEDYQSILQYANRRHIQVTKVADFRALKCGPLRHPPYFENW